MDCEICSTPTANLKGLISHLRLVHGEDENFSACCPMNCNQQVFTSFGALNSHMYRRHRDAFNLEKAILSQDQVPILSVPQNPSQVTEQYEDIFTQHDLSYDVSHLLGTDGFEQEKESASFLLKLREVRLLSHVATLDVIDGNCKMFDRTVSRVKAVIKDVLHQNGVTYSEIEGLDSALSSLSPPYEHLETIHKQDSFFRDHFSFLEPEEVSYSDRSFYVNRFSGQKRQKVQSRDVFYYVPFLKTLELLLKNADVYNEIHLPRSATDKILDFCDGTNYQQSAMFSSDKKALQIIAYYDEVEICNPLGSYVKKHKLGCLFFTIGNIRPRYRSSLRSIFLAAIGKYTDIEEYGIDSFLRPFVEDIKTLYCDGLSVDGSVYHGALLAFLADTKAAHQLGGFKESQSFARRICRSCMTTTEEAQTCFKEEDCCLRTPEQHFESCQNLSGLSNDQVSIDSGINRLSILEEVPEFSVVKCLPHDVMHDVFEGVVNYELKYFLCHCLDKKYFSIPDLNQRIIHFDFGDKDKPTLLDRARLVDVQKKIRQKASQMMSLILNLPILLGDKIPEDDKHWHSILVLIKICQIVLCWSYSRDTAAYFKVLVEEKLSLLQELYPTETMKPKMHYLVHYGTQIESFGPLVHTWTMRYEAKLSFIKRSSRRGNFKNICRTVARHHQLWFCYQLSVEPHLLYQFPEIGPTVSESSVCSEPEHIQRQIRKWCKAACPLSTVTHYNWLQLQSTRYKSGGAILLEWSLLFPKFGKICDILHCDSVYFLLVELFSTSHFCTHLNSYVVSPSSQVTLVCTEELFDYHCFLFRKSFKRNDVNLYVCMPYLPSDS